MKKIIIAYLLCMFAAVHIMATDNLKVWMNNPVMVADGKTVTYLTIYQTDAEDEYWNFEVHISLPAGIHIAKREEKRGKMVDDVKLNADRFEDMPHTIGVSMPDATSFVAICTNMTSKTPYYNDDADGNIVEELFTVGLVADAEMVNGTYDISVDVAKFVRTDVTGHTLTNCSTSKMTITGGVDNSSDYMYTLSAAGYGTLILPFEAELPEGVKAYTCSALDGLKLVLEEQSVVPACTPVILAGTPGSYVFTGTGEASEDSYTTGLLTGVLRATVIDDGYVLQQQAGKVGFYCVDPNNPKTVPANRCYLSIPATVKMFNLEVADGIESIMTNTTSKAYDLNGRPATSNTRGVEITNGHKVLKK